MIKSGGEWISSVELENAMMGHPAVAEAAVIAMPHEKWAERPLAVVVFKEGADRDRRAAARASLAAAVREVVAPRPLRVRGRDPEDGRREVQEDRASRAVRRRGTGRDARRHVLRAVLLRETGGPEQLEVVEVDPPEPADGQVLVRVRAAGINFLDVLVRQGRYPQMPELPTVPGSEVAGEVDGRRVMALPRADAGGYAEWVAVDESLLVPLPDAASFEEGAAFLLTFLTVWIPLTRQVRLGEGATVLVHAGAGGVGSAGIQVAKHLGARVVATASSEEKLEVARSLGADEALRYDGFEERVKRGRRARSGGRGGLQAVARDAEPARRARRARFRRRLVGAARSGAARRSERRRASASTSGG